MSIFKGNVSKWDDDTLVRKRRKFRRRLEKNPENKKAARRLQKIRDESRDRQLAKDADAIQTNQQVGEVSSGLMQNVMNQGAFTPTGLPSFTDQNYDQWRQAAQDQAMGYFDQQMEPQFAREEEDFRQRMVNQGVDPSSERYQREYDQLRQTQDNARNQARFNAFQAGQAEQAQQFGQTLGANQQMFNQQLQQYQLPMQQLQAFNPYYQSMQQAYTNQVNQQFQAQQNALDRDLQRWRDQLAMSGRGGGGGGVPRAPQDPFLDYYNNLVQQGLNNAAGMPQGGWQDAAIAGAAQGISAGLGAALV